MSIYSLSTGKMIDISVPENLEKNNLPIGTVLQFEGYGNHRKVIVANEGINARFPEYGARYRSVDLVDYTEMIHETFSLKYLSEKKDGRIAVYITDEVQSSDDVKQAIEQAKIKEEFLGNEKARKEELRINEVMVLKREHPFLIQGQGRVIAAKNIRIELKRNFPSIKFSVTSKSFSMGNSIDVSWENGPTTKAVDAIIDKYQDGDFDGMDDSYTYRQDVWTEVFGGSKYVNGNRHISDSIMEKTAREIVESYGQAWTGLDTYYKEPRNDNGYQIAWRALQDVDLNGVLV